MRPSQRQSNDTIGAPAYTRARWSSTTRALTACGQKASTMNSQSGLSLNFMRPRSCRQAL
eukprot:scaffold4482_cov393-Prasinococcus_capsulatus_cf.AAC.16